MLIYITKYLLLPFRVRIIVFFILYFIYVMFAYENDNFILQNSVECMKRSNPIRPEQEDPAMIRQLQDEIDSLNTYLNQLELRVQTAERLHARDYLLHQEFTRHYESNQDYMLTSNRDLQEKLDVAERTAGEIAGTNFELRCDMLEQAEEHNRVRTELELGKKLAEDELANFKKR